MEEEYKKEVSNIYESILDLNNYLMEKSNETDKLGNESFEDVMDFFITSHALSFIKNIYLGLDDSIGTIFNVRCIIEGMGILKIYQKGEINKEQEELFKNQYKILEYNCYKKYGESDLLVHMEPLKQEYDNEIKKYDKYHFTKDKLRKILGSNMPCLLGKYSSYKDLIEKNFSDDIVKWYKLLSQIVHPSDYFILKKVTDIDNCYKTIIKLLKDRYYKNDGKLSHKLEIETNVFFKNDTYVYTYGELDLIKETIAILSEKSNTNYFSNILFKLGNLNLDLITDSLMGFTNQVKVKTKIVFEFLSFLDSAFDDDIDVIDRYRLLSAYTINKYEMNILNMKEDISTIYKIYKEIYPNGLNEKDFSVYFNNNLGFMINEKGIRNNKGKQYTFCELSKNLINKYREEMSNDIFKDVNIYYLESQLLSHANGYMYYANTGAWCDCDLTNIILDYEIYKYLKGIENYYKKIDQKNNNNKYKTLRNALRHISEKYHLIMTAKCKYLFEVQPYKINL